MKWTDWIVTVVTHPVTNIAVGSAIGGNLRYWFGRWVDSQIWSKGLPWGTFIINVSGSFLLGFFAVLFLERFAPAKREHYLFLGTGFCGGYTTFSTLQWEAYKLVREGSWRTALFYIGGSMLIGFVSVVSGAMLSHLLFGRR